MSVNWQGGGLEIGIKVEDLLEEYCEELEEEVDKAARGTAAATANYLKKHSPKGKGKRHYADGWKSKRVARRSYVVHNTTKPSLTWLLNNDHAKAGGTGTVKGDGHIDEADKWAESEFMSRMEKVL